MGGKTAGGIASNALGPGRTEPHQTTIVVHGGAVFVKLLQSRATTYDIDYLSLAAYTDLLLESEGLLDSVVAISQEISAIGTEVGLVDSWMNFTADPVIGQIGDAVEVDEEG